MASNKFSPLFEIHLDSVGSNEFVVEIGPHTANNLGSGGSSFLASPDYIDDADSIYFYFGWTTVNGGWMVRRQVRLTALTSDATVANNSGVTNITDAWTTRASLTYS